MTASLTKTSLLVALILCLAGCMWWRQDPAPDHAAALLGVGYIYQGDGAAGTTILLDPRAVQIAQSLDANTLIEHLDDARIGRPIFIPGNAPAIEVPLGYLCLDVLIAGLEGESRQRIALDTNDDGSGTNVPESLYFRPDVLRQADGFSEMARVKAAWRAVVDEKPIKWSVKAYTLQR